MKVYLGSDASPGSPKKQINDSMPPYLHSVIVNEEAKKNRTTFIQICFGMKNGVEMGVEW